MARRRKRKNRALGAAKGPVSCPRPGYGQTLAGTLVGDMVNGAVAVGGAIGGALLLSGVVPWNIQRPSDVKRAAVGAMLGGTVGYVAGIPLAMLADRSILRSKDCPRAGLGRLFGARVAKGAVVGGAIYAARAITPEHARKVVPLVSVAGLFATVPLTQAIIRT